MKRTLLKGIASYLVAATLLTGCGAANNGNEGKNGYEKLDTDLKVGMMTDAGTIDDRSFNQYTWEAVSGVISNSKYLKPAGQTDADYIESIGNLYDAGYKFIVAPGSRVERAIGVAQEKYPDAEFVILDGEPVDSEGNPCIASNSTAIYFAEEEAGFIAAVAAAVEIKEGEFGFLGGMEIPPVQRFSYGFEQGVNYANENLGTNIVLKDENIVYQGSFGDKAGGQQVAGSMYDKGVDVIFTAAGGTGIGALNEAKSRAMNGETDCFIIGVDVDQYQDGVYDAANNASVILTSAIKKITEATISVLKDKVNGQFPGGQILTFNVANDGVGIPENNPNLGEEATNAASEVTNKIKAGEITVAKEK